MPASHDSFAHLHEELRMSKQTRRRIKAAWMVLRGEWIAQKPGPEVWAGFQDPYSNTASSNCTVTWTQPQKPPFDPRRAGRRAVRKHADALRRLAR